MRKAMFVAAAAAALVLAALPAQAKVAGQATISGPGLGGGAGDGGGNGSITLSGSDGGGWAAFSGLLDTARAGADRAPTEALGPRYRVVLDVRQPPQRTDVVQYLYPFAEPGPLLYTPPGQRLLDFEAPSGWWGASTDLIELLDDSGFPQEAPVVAQQPAPRSAPQSPQPAVTPVAWALIGLTGLLVAGAIATRRRAARASTA